MLMACQVFAQEEEAKRAVKEVLPDSLKPDFIPSGIRLGTDLIAIGKTFAKPQYTELELNIEIPIHKYFVVVDLGTWDVSRGSEFSTYSSTGNYFRAGLDMDFFWKDLTDESSIFFGFRYGRSRYSDALYYYYNDIAWETDGQIRLVNNQVTARWFEITSGLKVPVYKGLWMGFTARLKLGLKITGDDLHASYEVPGYGKTIKNTWWGFNYQVFYNIPFRK